MSQSYLSSDLKAGDLKIPVVSTVLNSSDFLGAMMVRWGINRGNYRVKPGLYAVGTPGPDSDIFVTANYKLSFDHLRKNLKDFNCWILVLDTKGVNVWCAAGKRTFSTEELVGKIKNTGLSAVVTHRRIILPQLGATGVSAHKVREQTGFNVHYGPVRAADINAFVKAGYRASGEMRQVKFGLWERLKLIPNDLIQGRTYLLIAILIAAAIGGFGISETKPFYSFSSAFKGIICVLTGYVSGVIIAPALLPLIPFRMFSVKGMIIGIIAGAVLWLIVFENLHLFQKIGWAIIITAISSFMTMNFTGSSTYTSLSGVKREMKISLPLQIAIAGSGILLIILSWFVTL